jgi:ureidomalonase
VPEFGLGSQTFNGVFGTTLNAYDQSRCAGGSSGGAAVALALRMLPVADGGDFMGSLRNPAAFNNVTGFRPSIGRVPDPGFLSSPAVVGPMARTVGDAAMLLSVMAGPDAHSPSSIEQDPQMFAPPLAPITRPVRVAWTADFNGYLAAEPDVLRLCENGLRALEDLGCVVEPALPKMSPELVWDTFVTWRHLLVYESLRCLYDRPETREQIKPEAVWEIAAGERLTAAEIASAHEGRAQWFEAVATLLDDFDVIAAPSAQVFPFDARIRWPAEIEGRPMDTYHRWMETVAPWSLAGLPALNVPVGFNASGLPMGMQLIGRSHADLDVLRLGAAYDESTRWPARVLPPLLLGS